MIRPRRTRNAAREPAPSSFQQRAANTQSNYEKNVSKINEARPSEQAPKEQTRSVADLHRYLERGYDERAKLNLRRFIHRDVFTTYTSTNRQVPQDLYFREAYIVHRDSYSRPRESLPMKENYPAPQYHQVRIRRDSASNNDDIDDATMRAFNFTTTPMGPPGAATRRVTAPASTTTSTSTVLTPPGSPKQLYRQSLSTTPSSDEEDDDEEGAGRCFTPPHRNSHDGESSVTSEDPPSPIYNMCPSRMERTLNVQKRQSRPNLKLDCASVQDRSLKHQPHGHTPREAQPAGEPHRLAKQRAKSEAALRKPIQKSSTTTNEIEDHQQQQFQRSRKRTKSMDFGLKRLSTLFKSSSSNGSPTPPPVPHLPPDLQPGFESMRINDQPPAIRVQDNEFFTTEQQQQNNQAIGLHRARSKSFSATTTRNSYDIGGSPVSSNKEFDFLLDKSGSNSPPKPSRIHNNSGAFQQQPATSLAPHPPDQQRPQYSRSHRSHDSQASSNVDSLEPTPVDMKKPAALMDVTLRAGDVTIDAGIPPKVPPHRVISNPNVVSANAGKHRTVSSIDVSNGIKNCYSDQQPLNKEHAAGPGGGAARPGTDCTNQATAPGARSMGRYRKNASESNIAVAQASDIYTRKCSFRRPGGHPSSSSGETGTRTAAIDESQPANVHQKSKSVGQGHEFMLPGYDETRTKLHVVNESSDRLVGLGASGMERAEGKLPSAGTTAAQSTWGRHREEASVSQTSQAAISRRQPGRRDYYSCYGNLDNRANIGVNGHVGTGRENYYRTTGNNMGSSYYSGQDNNIDDEHDDNDDDAVSFITMSDKSYDEPMRPSASSYCHYFGLDLLSDRPKSNIRSGDLWNDRGQRFLSRNR